jgi:hypothetical protein
LASTTAFLCLVVAHLEWPDMRNLRNQLLRIDQRGETPGARLRHHAGQGRR